MFPFTKNVMFASVDLAFVVRENEAMLATTFTSVIDTARKRKISCSTPLNPLNVSPHEKSQDAFQLAF